MKLTNKIYIRAFAAISCALMPAMAWGIPAKPGSVTVEQPDGTVLTVRLVGDEHAHRTLSEDGHLLMTDEAGMYCYAIEENGTLKPSGVRASQIGMRSGVERSFVDRLDSNRILTKATELDNARRSEIKESNATRSAARLPNADGINLLFTDVFPTTGSSHSIVILVNFKDEKFMTKDANDYFTRMLNQSGFRDNGATGSVIDYFSENSMGVFTPVFDVYGPIDLSNNRAYYGGNDYYGNDRNPDKMIIEACELLDEEVDFSLYDTDGDGYIDNVYVFYAGYGEADSGIANTVWPHSWDIISGTGQYRTFDGVLLNHYATSNEIDYFTKNPDGIGTFVHEFSHVMGLPDLYSTVYNDAFTPGEWSVLDYGPYNNDGRTPPNYSAFERYALGWLEPKSFKTGELTLAPITDNVAYKVSTGTPSEFFLIEKREQLGWDEYVPYSGMLVWYVDYRQSIWDNNSVNNTPSRQGVDLIEADNRRTAGSRAGDCFPGYDNVTEFSLTSYPAFTDRRGNGVGVEIFDITYSDTDIYFDPVPEDPLTMRVVVEGDPGEPDPSGVETLTDQCYYLNGRQLGTYVPMNVYDITGRTIAKMTEGDVYTFPEKGVYILNASGATLRLLVK